MGDRTAYGNLFSENGWRMVDADSCVWITVPGAPVQLQIREGQPAKILAAWCADWNAYVEPMRNADSACWTLTNDVASSNHLSGTAVDINWQSHPFRVANAGLNGAQIATVEEMLDWYEDLVFWGNNWNSPKDTMHCQMNGDTYGAENVAKVQGFIDRKIRADGFSMFRRGGVVITPAPPVVIVKPPQNITAIDVLVAATGINGALARDLIGQVSFALAKANCTNPRRIAAALAQWVIESGHFVYTEEIADGPETQERWKYKGRTWVQLTWLENYAGFSRWVYSLGLVPTDDYFVQRPKELADQKWAALGPAYWWAIKYPQINEYADRGDIDNVSKWVNAPAWVDKPDKHANGERERRDAYNKALALGDKLLVLVTTAIPTPPTGDDMSAADVARLEGKIDTLVNEWGPRKIGPSRAIMATDGAGVASPLGFLYNDDGNTWDMKMTWAYLFDVELAVTVVETIARDGVYDGSWVGSEDFNEWLAEFGQQYCQGLVAFKAALVQTLTGAPTSDTRTTNVANVTAPSAAEIASAVAALLPAIDDGAKASLLAMQRALDDERKETTKLREQNAQLMTHNVQLISAPTTQLEPLTGELSVPGVLEAPQLTPGILSGKAVGDVAGVVVDSVREWTSRLTKMTPEELAALGTALTALQPPGRQEQS